MDKFLKNTSYSQTIPQWPPVARSPAPHLLLATLNTLTAANLNRTRCHMVVATLLTYSLIIIIMIDNNCVVPMLMSLRCCYCVTGRSGTAAWLRRCSTWMIQSTSPAQVRKGSTRTTTGRRPCRVTTFGGSTWPCQTVAVRPDFCCITDLPFTATSTRRRAATRLHTTAAVTVLPSRRYCFCC